MFDWYSVGLAMACAGFVGVFIGYGLAILLEHLKEPKRTPYQYNVLDEAHLILEDLERKK